MVEVDKLLKETVKKGEVKIGSKETEEIVKKGEAEIVVISENCPNASEITDLTKKRKIPLYNYDSNSVDLGYTCGKAFPVSALAVLEDGGTNISKKIG